MINVMMVCHGNICRSTMAEFVLKDMVEKEGLADKFHIDSSATSREEIGNPVHHGPRKKLAEVGISTAGKYARQITKKDYKEFDYILIMDDMNKGLADKFHIESSATSREEIGNPVHHGTRKKLAEVGISTAGKYARQITKKDYKEFDYILIMDDMNRRNLKRVVGEDVDNKLYKLLHFAGSERDIADPWYTGNFDVTYDDVMEGCSAFLEYCKKNEL